MNTAKFIDRYGVEREIGLYTEEKLGDIIIPVPVSHEVINLGNMIAFSNTSPIEELGNNFDFRDDASENDRFIAVLTAITACASVVNIQYNDNNLIFVAINVITKHDNRQEYNSIMLKNDNKKDLSIKGLSDYIKNNLIK